MKVSDEGRALGGRKGTIGSVMAPSLTRRVRSRPSLPITYRGSTPPKGIGASTVLVGAGGGETSAGATAEGTISLRTAAPLPGAPTELFAPLPKSPPSKAEASSDVRLVGVATSPPGQSHELAGVPPVAAA